MKKKFKVFSFLFASFMLAFTCLLALDLKKNDNVDNQEVTRTIESQNLDFNDYYARLQQDCENVEMVYDEGANTFNLTATQVITRDMFEEIDNLSLNEDFDSVAVTYKTEYNPETNIVTLTAFSDGEKSDELYGSPFTTEEGNIDVAFYADGEIIYLSELQDAGLIQNCGWFSRMLRKIAKVVAVVAVVAVAVVAVAAVAYVAAPVVASVVTTTVVGASSGAAVLGASAATAAAVATAATTVATTAATVAVAAATVAATAAITAEVIESATGSLTINDTYTIGAEGRDEATKQLVKKIAATATIATLREMTRSYHIAFVVAQEFRDASGKTYSVGDLYMSELSLSFDEAYAVLIKSGMVNAGANLTSNLDILDDIAKAVITADMTKLIDVLKTYKKNGYFSTKTQGIYADSVTAAATLAAVSGAWMHTDDAALVGRGGAGGYYHFHNALRTIHIWYGDKI